ncbi:MAG: NAD(P)-dependent oxidoreductase [Roseovarius sp.]|nr:NAD(P)-dependent oxidoreductase [Roseovarius sp.]
MVPNRLARRQYADNFSDLHPRLNDHEAMVAADQCYFCHDAPCVDACPTEIDIPLFIRQIATRTPEAAAKTIFSQNILGGMCARVCPTETLCEQACVREVAESKPVKIGQLQRYATDALMDSDIHPFNRAASTGKKIAVAGAGPAGLACAHRLAMKGHDVAIFEARGKPGGLNEFGIAAYKTVDGFAKREIDWLLQIGGITLKPGVRIGGNLTIRQLKADFDAVFLGIGLGGTGRLGLENEDMAGIRDAVDFIAELRQAGDFSKIPVGRDVVVVGGGMTAIDAAVQSRLLGALNVTLAYRRSLDMMKASRHERDLATSKGVRIITGSVPVAIRGNGSVEEIEFEYSDDNLEPTGHKFAIPADQVLKAIGQKLADADLPETENGKIKTTGAGRTSTEGIWAGGDCTLARDDLTVTAVAEGRDAAEDIDRCLMS